MRFLRSMATIAAAFLPAVALVTAAAPGGANASTASASNRIEIHRQVSVSGGAYILCLTPYGGQTKKGIRLVQYTCNDDPSQNFYYQREAWGYLFVNEKSGLCIAPSGGGRSNGTYLVLDTCTGAESQSWIWDDTKHDIRTVVFEQHITPYGGGNGLNTDLVLWEASNASPASQDWYIDPFAT
jgi:hypothetical protein